MSTKLISPRTLKGFRDYLPAVMIPREGLMEKARAVFRSFGFVPIDTPALEYTEILLGKGGAESDKQLYRFNDSGGRDVALRFDLTVPFARFMAQHGPELGVPFKRYHIAPVWRGENTQRGRYREFYQCDFDTIGTTANASDIEILIVIHDLLAALGLSNFQIRINNRMILNGLLEELNLTEHVTTVLRSLDKLAKVGPEAVEQEICEHTGISKEAAGRALNLARMEGSNEEILSKLQTDYGANEFASRGISNLRELLKVTREAGLDEDKIQVDLSIARGLDYYTGTVFETILTDLPGIGSVCSGGRYDNLASLYTKQTLPGVGASLGLDRLIAALEELDMLQMGYAAPSIFLVQFAPEYLGAYHNVARRLRAAGLTVELFPEPKKIGQQLNHADKNGHRFALIAGPDEFAKSVWQVKDLTKRESREVSDQDLVKELAELVSNLS